MKQLVNEFKAFLIQGNLLTLAVAFVMGLAFAAVLNSFVGDIITPIIGAIFGKSDFSNLTFTIHKSLFRYGAFITAVISFVSIAAAVFFVVVKPYELYMSRIRGPEEEVVPDDERRHQELLAAIRGISR